MKSKTLAVVMILIIFLSSTAISVPIKLAKANGTVIRTLFDQDVAWAHVKVEEYSDSVKWTIDLNENSAYLNNPVAGIVVIIGLGNEIEFQIHNNDGIDPHYPYGTWLISYYENGWRTGSPYYANYPLPDGITTTGGRSKSENPQMIFTVTIAKSYLANEFKWAVYFKGGSGGRTFFPSDFSWSDTDTSDMATAKYLILGGAVATLAKAVGTNAKYFWGSGCWAAVLGQKFEVYIDPTLPPFDALGAFKIDDIASISYHTNTPHPITGTTPHNFYMIIYTKPDGIDDKSGWYGYRLIGEPYLSKNLNAPANQWNKWSTDAGTNQLTFFDPDTIGFYGFYGQPTLQNIQAGPINWHDYYSGCPVTNIDYGVEVVKYISFQTATGWMNVFQGCVDAITIALKDGTTVSVDLEGFASEVWVNDDWAGLPPGYEVEPGKFVGYNAFAKIQDGINAVMEGGTVYVCPGTYVEVLTVSKNNLTITSTDGPNTTIIKQADTNAITITGNYNKFEGFTIKDETNHAHAHRLFIVHGDYNVIRGNVLIGRKGISGAGHDYLISIRGDAVGDGIAKGNIIENNEVCNANYNGINVGGTYKAEDTVIRGNKVSGCTNAGIAVDRAPKTLVENNLISNCNVGLYVEGREADGRSVSGALITANIIQNNLIGAQFRGANGVTVTCNTIKENSIGVQIIPPAAGSYGTPVINYNNIHGNTEYGAENRITELLDAQYNWWGDLTGPYHQTLNPTGLGDKVSDNVNFEPWLLTEKVPPLVHDVAVLNVVPSAIRVTPGTTVHVDVTVKNEGNTYETLDVSLFYGNHLIGTQTIIDMVPGSTKHLTFNWDTSGVPYGTYTLKAEATVVPGETDTSDNVFVNGIVRIGPEALIMVEPTLYQAQLLNKMFQVNVTINDLWEGWRAVAVQFRLCYNETLLKVVDVTQGAFMQDPRWNLHGTFFIWFDEPNDPIYGSHVIVGILLLPDPNTGVWEAFPRGSGVLATITFKTIYQERGLEKPPLTCELKLVDAMVIDDDLEEIPLTLEHGLYKMHPTHIGDINYDGKVDMKDIAMVSRAFGSYPGYGPWNPICDVNNDGKVDLKDVAIVSKGFGWTYIYDP